MARITLEAISHTYDRSKLPPEQKTYAVSDLSIHWEDGTANALLGPSGCGKTTILNIISGLLVPTHGRILVDDADATRLSPRKRRIAQIFQFPVVYDSMNVFDNLAFPLRNQKTPEDKVKKKVAEVAEILDLSEILSYSAAQLNPAEKQKISLGRGIVREDTAAVLLDEPLTVIDPKLKGNLRRKLRQVQQDLKKTMIYVTHDQHEALTFADDVTIIKDGRLIQQGSPEELHSHPATPFIGYFIGSPGINVLPCRLAENETLAFDDFNLEVSPAFARTLKSHGQEFELGIRPEFIRTHAEETPDGIAFEVVLIENTGAYWVVTFEKGNTRIKARVPESFSVQEGKTFWLSFPEDKVNMFFEGRRII